MMLWSLAACVIFASMSKATPISHFQLDKDDSYDTATAWKEKGNEFRVLQFIFRKAEDIDSIEAAATPVQAREDYSIRKRRKRSPISLLAAKGLLAVKFLITGAKETKSNSRRFRSFQKTGDFETAKGDFFAVFPSNVKYHRGATQPLRTSEGRSYSGTVGDRRIFLKEFGVKADGYRPTIQVTEPILTPGPYVDKIVYKNKG